MENKKEYKSLGATLKAGDFTKLLEDFLKMDADTKKDFFTPKNDEVFSEATQLLYFLPDYCKNKEGVELKQDVIPVLSFLLENGADPTARMHNGVRAFLKACATDSVELVKYLIENDFVKINTSVTDGMSNDALHYAVMSEATNVIDYLVKEAGFDINKQNFIHHNNTVLHYACGHGKEKSIDKLLELGANPLLEDFNENKPYDLMVLGYNQDEIDDYYGDNPDEEDLKEIEKWKRMYDKMDVATKNFETKKVEKQDKKRRTVF